MSTADQPHLTDREITAAFADAKWGAEYPPVLSLAQAANLLQVPLQTLYQWRSRGYLKGCSRRVGKRVLVFRDRLLKRVFNEGINNDT
ncbi:MAG TPA: helix-turn-helix domain-containing protein [Pirellulaceae bacterium]|nr:helix-turn-helix domain-containing protein [Pirellulaceae bacterium]